MTDKNDDTKNISTSGTLPSNFDQQAKADEERHKEADEEDQSGELDTLGEDDRNEPLDIDDAKEKMDLGEVNDDK